MDSKSFVSLQKKSGPSNTGGNQSYSIYGCLQNEPSPSSKFAGSAETTSGHKAYSSWLAIIRLV